jgi:serine palmitoyltransferase
MSLICENLYSMEGSMSPAPALIASKRVYNFCLLVDEAHSFMSIGSAGRGTFNRWQDLGYDCPFAGVDVMTFTFSKGVSSTGGFALANGIHADALRKQGQALSLQGVESLSTVVLLRFLSILMKPKLVEERMQIVLEKSNHVAAKLKEASFRVLSAPGSPMICFPVGKSI